MTLSGWPVPGLGLERNRLREEVDRLFSGLTGATAGVFPAVNIYDDGQQFLVRAEIPGVDKDKLEITARGDQLLLRGERVLEAAEGRAHYHRREREAGTFRRVVTLPQRVDSEKVTASYRNGILEVLLPRVAEVQPRKIQIS